MRICCPNCGAILTLQIEQFGDTSELVCWMCTSVIGLDSVPTDQGPPTVEVPASPHDRSKVSRLDGLPNSHTATLALPQDRIIKLSVISGSSQGMEFELSRPLVTIGRLGGGADMEIDDPEVSRLHCAIEVRRDGILLNDLDSTNGTYLRHARISVVRLDPMSIFRIGTSHLQLKTT
jgi:hypothetical protein